MNENNRLIVEEEIWLPIEGYEHYEASNLGRIRSFDRAVNGFAGIKIKKRKILTPVIVSKYYRVCLHVKGKVTNQHIHRLIAIAFIPNPENKPTVNHIDGNKLNNRLDNLEWATRSEQTLHAIRTGLYCPPQLPHLKGIKNKSSKPVIQFDLDGRQLNEFACGRDASKYIGIHFTTMSVVCRTGGGIIKGFKWAYKQ